MDETSGHGLVLPLGRALSELLASPSSPSAAGSRKVLRKAQRQFDAAKAQVLLRRQRRGGEAGEQDLVGDKPGGPHAGRAAPLVDALLTVDEFLYQLAQDLPSPSSLLPSLSDKNLSPRTFNVSLIMTPLLEAFSRPELSAKQRKEERRHVSRFCQWLLCHPQGAALCHAYFEHTLRVGADRGMKMQVLELLQDQLKRGVFCKIRDRIVAPTLGHGSAFAVRQGHKQQSRQHSRRVLIEEADLDSLDSPPNSAAPPPVSPLSSVNPLDAAVASLRGLVWCARHDESETHPGAPTRLTLASLDCAVRLCYQISVVVSPSPPSSTLSPRTRDPIVYMPYWCERMAEVNPKNGKTVSSGSAAACANAMEDDNVAHQRQQQGIAGKRWLWKSRSLVPDIINVLLRWVKMSARGAVQQEESAARDSSTVPSLLQMALESCLEELTYWSSVPATGATRKEQDTEEQNLDQYSCAQNMADVAKIFEDQKNNAPSSSSDDSAIDALAWHFRIYAPFLVNRTRLVHLPTNSGDGQDGSANLLFKVLLGEFEGWFRQCALPSVEPSTVSVGLRCLALQMGRCQAAATALASGDTVAGARAVRAALATHLGMSGCLQGLILHLGHRAETSQQLALALARNLLFGGLQSQSVPQDDNDNACRNAPNEDTLVDTEALLSSLLTMLDQHGDAISRAAVCLIADVAVQRPKHVLPSLFARLERAPSQGELDSVQTPQSLIVDTEEDEGRKNTQNDEAKAAARVKLARRQNTLAVIEEMFRVNSELLDNRVGEPHPQQQLRRRGSVTVPLDKDLTGILVSHMLQRLQDSELVLRTQASALFARLQPARVVPQLCKMICSRDARTRSAAERSLSEVMTSRSNRDPCKTLMTLLDCLRHHGSSNKSEEEEEEEKPNREETFTERAIDRVVRLSPRWVDGLASRRQQSRIFLAVLRKMAAAPSDLTLVKLMSKMARAQATTESPRVFSTILRAVVERMEGQTCLDRDMLFQDTNNQEHIQALLFARTSPLLMLRALPMAAFDLYSSEKGEAFSTDAYALSIDDSDEETSDDDDSSDECGDDDKTSNSDTRADKLAKRDAFRLRCSITRLARELVHRSTRVYEFEQVRKLSAELISRLPLSEFVLPFVASHLEYFVTSLQENAEGRGQQDVDAAFLPRSFQSAGPDVAVVKATVFCACNAVMLRCTLITPRPDVNSQQQQQQHQHQQQQQQQQHQHQQQLKQHQEDVSKACLDLIFRSVAPWLFCILSIPLPRADSSEKVMSGLEKLQRGCIDCLACMCKAKALMDSRSIRTSSMSAATNTRGLIQVIDDGDDDANGGECAPSGGRCNRVEDADPLGMVLDLLCGNIGLAETLHADFRCDSKATGLGREETTQIPFRICMANILISLIRMWQPARAIGADMDGLRINGSKPEAIGVEMDATRQSSIVCIVKDLASFSDQKQIDPTLRGAALQVIFIAIHQLQGDINDSSIPFGRVHALAMAASQDAVSPELRLAGLKLLAILIGKVKGIFSKALAGSAGHTKSVLSQLANIDASEQVRELAERILTSAFV